MPERPSEGGVLSEVGRILNEPQPWERWRLAGKFEQGAGFAGGDASAPRFLATIHV